MHLAGLSWGWFCCIPAGFIWCLQESTMSNNMAKIADARKTVEQLKLEVNIDRMMVRRIFMLNNLR